MRRSDNLIKIITLIVFVALAAYIGYYLYYMQANPLKTVLAIAYTSDDCAPTEGYAVRNETVLYGGGGSVSVLADDGEKISAGEVVAVEYKSSGAADRSSDEAALRLRIDQLETMLKSMDGGSIRASAYDSVTELSSAVGNGDLENLDRLLAEIDSFIFSDMSDYSEDGIKSEIDSCREQLDRLNGTVYSDTVYISPSRPGTFSSSADGLETVTPESLENLTVSGYFDLFKPSSPDKNAVGKMCYGTTWYYITAITDEIASRLSRGGYATMRFKKNYDATVQMKVDYISAEDDGMRVAVFSTNKYLPDVVSIRSLSADIVFSTYSGIRVPKEAVHIDDEGVKYVYLLSGVQSRRADLEILCDLGDYYIVSPLNSGVFHDGSEIIIKANGLHDGKVVQSGMGI